MNVLFDLDGTLSDNFPGISRSINHALAALGVAPQDDATLRAWVGPPLRQTFRALLDDDAARVERAIVLYRERFAEVGWRENSLYDGVEELLRELHDAGHRLWVCTSKPRVFARRIVEHFGLAPRFVEVYGADLGERLDTKARIIEELLQVEALQPPGCVMVGDRVHDVEAAAAHGIPAIGVLWGFGSAQELAGARALCATPQALRDELLARARRPAPGAAPAQAFP